MILIAPTTPSGGWPRRAPASSCPVPIEFEVLPGVGHFAADQAPDRVNALLLAHLAKHPA